MLDCHRFRYHLIITIQPTTPTTLVCVEIILGARAAVRSIERRRKKKETRHNNAFKKLKHLQFIYTKAVHI